MVEVMMVVMERNIRGGGDDGVVMMVEVKMVVIEREVRRSGGDRGVCWWWS